MRTARTRACRVHTRVNAKLSTASLVFAGVRTRHARVRAPQARGLKLQRLGLIMEPEPGNPHEIEGVLNPAAVRGPDGELYLFPRLVAKGNYSRIGIARVRFNAAGDPKGVERLGIALEPEADYELRPNGGGGCEDPRITFVEPLQRYMMSYTAFSARGPRIALAVSKDLFPWQRLGLARLRALRGHRVRRRGQQGRQSFPCRNPQSIRASGNGHSAPAAFSRHASGRNGASPRNRVSGSRSREHLDFLLSDGAGRRDSACLGLFTSHHRLATPVSPWERLKIGAGTPPVLTRHGWLIVYHGVSEMPQSGNNDYPHCYSAGVMLLSKEHPQIIRYRSADPVLTPSLPQERDGTVANVVFPTGIDRRDDLGLPDRFDIYYGMADNRIGVARLDMPESIAGLENEVSA